MAGNAPDRGDLRLTVDTARFAAVSAELKKFRPELRKAMRKAIRDSAKPAVQSVRRAALAIPAQGSSGSTGLRRNIARGVRIDLADRGWRTGLAIRATSRALPSSQAGMQRRMNSKSFRHPVYGNRDVWVTQSGHPYFEDAVREHVPNMRRAVFDAITEAERAADLK